MTLCSNSEKSDTKPSYRFMVDCLRGRLSRKRKKLKFSNSFDPEVFVCDLIKRNKSGNENPSEKFIYSSISN